MADGQAVEAPAGAFVELHPVDGRRMSPSGVALVSTGGWRMELEAGFDPATLEQVLVCVGRCGPCSP